MRFVDELDRIRDQLCHEVVRVIERRKAAEEEVQRLQNKEVELEASIERARNFSGLKDLECPYCYVEGRNAKVSAIDGDDHVDRLRCKACGSTFEKDIP